MIGTSILFDNVSFGWLLRFLMFSCTLSAALCWQSTVFLVFTVFSARPTAATKSQHLANMLPDLPKIFLDCDRAASPQHFVAGHDSFQEFNFNPRPQNGRSTHRLKMLHVKKAVFHGSLFFGTRTNLSSSGIPR